MQPEAIVEMIFMSLVTGALGTLFWARLNRQDADLANIRSQLAAVATREEVQDVRGKLSDVRSQMVTREDLQDIKGELADVRSQMATREDLADVRQRMATKEDMAQLRADMASIREEMAVMRSDLTHVALAVGANRPKPMEG